jgi:aminoglycoside phosphotransferase (APT) family kinase protein
VSGCPATRSRAHDDTTILPANLAAQIAADAGRFFGLTQPVDIVRIEARVHPYSRVVRVELAWRTGSQHLYVKLPVPPPGGDTVVAARLQAEFRILNALGEGFAAHPRLGVVRALGFYPEHLAIVTLEAPGPTLKHVLGRAARRLRVSRQRCALVEHVQLCGTWLRTFQTLTARGTASFDRDEMLGYCTIRANRLAELSDTWGKGGLSTRLLTRLDQVIGSIRMDENRVSGRHNDFAMHNIIAGTNGITVLDLSMFDYGSTAFDACNFWLALELLKSDPTYARTFLADLQNAFLESYGEIDPAHALFAAVRCRYSLNRLLTVLDDAARRPLGWFGQRIAQTCQAWLCDFAESRTLAGGRDAR